MEDPFPAKICFESNVKKQFHFQTKCSYQYTGGDSDSWWTAFRLLVFLVTLCVLFGIFLLVKDLRNKTAFNSKEDVLRQQQYAKLKNDTVIHVCLSVDEHDLVGLITLMNSIWKNTKAEVLFHILCEEDIKIQIQNWLALPELKAIHYDLQAITEKDLDRIKAQIKTLQHTGHQVSPMNVARIYYTKYFPDIKWRAIHIDADCVVLGDISELLTTTKLSLGHVIAASDDCSSSMKRFVSYQPVFSSFINFNNPHIAKLGLRPTECSFNTGVYVFDIPLWKELNITGQVEKWMYLNEKEEIFGSEKAGGVTGPPMMIVLHDKYTKFTDPRWNIRHLGLGTSKHLSSAFVNHAKLLHWSGPHKPWGVMAQYASVWDKYHVPDPAGIYTPVRKSRKKEPNAAEN